MCADREVMSKCFVQLCECVILCQVGGVEPAESFADVGTVAEFSSASDNSGREVHDLLNCSKVLSRAVAVDR